MQQMLEPNNSKSHIVSATWIASLILSCWLCFNPTALKAQNIYLINNANELFTLNDDLEPSFLFDLDIIEFGYLVDIAFSPDGKLYGTTNYWYLVEIDLLAQTLIEVTTLPEGNNYPGLVATPDTNLVLCKQFLQELYTYDISADTLIFLESGISTPGDFTYFKGNLIYPNLFNEFIQAYDGETITNVACSVPLIYGFTNDYDFCTGNRVLAFDEESKVYEYDIEAGSYTQVADLWLSVGQTNGVATLTEYQAASCSLASLEEIDCDVLGISDHEAGDRLDIWPNPVLGSLTIDLDLQGDFRVELYSASGRLLGSEYGNSFPFQLDIHEIPGGVYTLQIHGQDEHFIAPIVKTD